MTARECDPLTKDGSHAWIFAAALDQPPASISRPRDERFFLTLQTAHLSGATPASPPPTPLPAATVNSLKTLNISHPQNLAYESAWQRQDGQRARPIRLPCRWRFRLRAPGPGPLLASMWLDKFSKAFQKTESCFLLLFNDPTPKLTPSCFFSTIIALYPFLGLETTIIFYLCAFPGSF